jgi:hypothetical protein
MESTDKFRLSDLNTVLNHTKVSGRTTKYFDQSKMNSNHMLELPDTAKYWFDQSRILGRMLGWTDISRQNWGISLSSKLGSINTDSFSQDRNLSHMLELFSTDNLSSKRILKHRKV